MRLRVFIAGKERANYSVQPAMVPDALRHIDSYLDRLEAMGKVVVTLDSDDHPNVVYLLKPGYTH